MNGKVNGQTGKGTFTIMEIQNGGWGRLKSGAGWIWLSNPTYCTVGKTVKNTEDSKKSIDEIVKKVIQGRWGIENFQFQPQVRLKIASNH